MKKGVSPLLSAVILILIVLAASVVIYTNFSKQITSYGKNLDLRADIEFKTTGSFSPTPNPPWLSDDWPYRRKIVITNHASSNLTDYQVLINSSILARRDIRFTDSDGQTLLNYWIENDTKGLIWVKVNITANSDKTIYVYYGNSSAPDLSDIDSVFIRNSIYLISTDWADNVAGSYADNHNEFDEAIASNPTVFGTGYVDKVNYDNNPYGRNDDFMLRFKFLFKATTTGTYYFGTDSDDASEIILNSGDKDVYHHVIASWYGGHGVSGYKYWQHDGSLYLNSGEAIWIEYRMQEWYGGQRASMGVKAPGGSWETLRTSRFPNQIYARKYVDPEPTVTIGDEEERPTSSELNLLLIGLYNTGNIPISRVIIKLGNTTIYDNSSANLEPGSSMKLRFELSGAYSIGETYTIFIEYHSPNGDLEIKQYEVEVEPM